MKGIKKRGYFWITILLFFASLAAHWYFGWQAFVREQDEHAQAPRLNDYLVEALRDTMENWQSEFLQLVWQVVGLSFLYYVGSPQSKEGDDRREAKIDRILQKLDPEEAEDFIKKAEKKYPKK